jgi:hypothetical protein
MARRLLACHLISVAGVTSCPLERLSLTPRDALRMTRCKLSFSIHFLLEAFHFTLCRSLGGARAIDAEGEQCNYGRAARI